MELRIEEIDDKRFDENVWKTVEDFKSKGFKVTIIDTETSTAVEDENCKKELILNQKNIRNIPTRSELESISERIKPVMDHVEWENVINDM